MKYILLLLSACVLTLAVAAEPARSLHGDPWVTYEPRPGTANGKYVVLLAGDEEYRSEEGLPQLGKILSQRHGFRCAVLFSQEEDGTIAPNNQTNVPGMRLLDGADLVFVQFRFRELPDSEMKHFVHYLDSGRPMVALRTATHAFHYQRNLQSPYAECDYLAPGGGFGGMTVGETWTYHHGDHGHEATRGLIEEKNRAHPILSGVADVFGATDVYGVNADFPADATVLLRGQVLTGMNPSDAPNTNKAIMPIVWLRSYHSASGRTSQMLCSTIGAAIDLECEDLRRLMVNTSFFLTGLPVPRRADVTLVGEYNPSMFGFDKYKRHVNVRDLDLR
jgi:hypothetical protein